MGRGRQLGVPRARTGSPLILCMQLGGNKAFRKPPIKNREKHPLRRSSALWGRACKGRRERTLEYRRVRPKGGFLRTVIGNRAKLGGIYGGTRDSSVGGGRAQERGVRRRGGRIDWRGFIKIGRDKNLKSS